MSKVSWLLDAAAGDGQGLVRLRHHTQQLLSTRRHPLHIGSVISSVLGGWDGTYSEDVFDYPELFEHVRHNSRRANPLPPGVLVNVHTQTRLGDLYGEVICSHLDPSRGSYDVDGNLESGIPDQHRAVVAFDCMPESIREPLDTFEMSRIRRAGTWLSADGHVYYSAADDGHDDLSRYCQWLAEAPRATLRTGLPDDAGRLETLAESIVGELSGYRATFVTFGQWLWLREMYEEQLGDAKGRLNRDELKRTLRLLAATYGSDRLRRTVAFELDDTAASWSTHERDQTILGTNWVRSLFTVNAYVAERLAGGAPVVNTRDGPVQMETQRAWGLGGLWHIDALTESDVHELQAAARADAEERAIEAMGRELLVAAPYPFTKRLSSEEFETGCIALPREVLDQLAEGIITVRLAFEPNGRFTSRSVAVASTEEPDQQGCMPLEWPALLAVGTTLQGRVIQRGRIVELKPVFST